VQHLVPDVPHIRLGLLAALQGLHRTLVAFFLEDVDEGGKLGSGRIIAAVILLGEFDPSTFFGQFGD
jgi:hypothetical protein